jgi:hypothetical protein
LGEHFGAVIKTYPTVEFVLLEGLWPSSNWRANYDHTSIPIVVDVDLEDPANPPYYGPRRMHLSLSTIAYIPFCDLFVGSFVLMWPLDPMVYSIWMGRAESDFVKDKKNENYRKVYVQWWVPMRKGAKNDEELYHNCSSSK